MGFFFAGILPRTRIGDVLIMQFLNNVDLDYDKITAYSDMAKEILNYIRGARSQPGGLMEYYRAFDVAGHCTRNCKCPRCRDMAAPHSVK